MRTHFVKNGALLLASTLVSLMAIESGLRIANGQSLWPNKNFLLERIHVANRIPMAEYDPLVGWAHKSHMSISPRLPQQSFTTGEFGIRMNKAEINAIPRNAILAIGDSFTAGSEVGDHASWPAVLERILGEPVVNAGVGGWGTDQIVLRTEYLIPKLTPKLIIVSFLEADISRAEYSVFGGGPKPYFLTDLKTIFHHNNPVPKTILGASIELGWLRSFLGYSYAVDWLMSRAGVANWFHVDPYVKIETDPAFVTCQLLGLLKRATEAQSIRLIFVMQWGGNEIALWPYRSLQAERVLECARDIKIQTIDTWDPLKEVFIHGSQELKKLYKMIQNNTVYEHMSPAGNEFIARLIADAVRHETNLDGASDSRPDPRAGLPVLGANAHLQDLTFMPGAASAPDGTRTAVLLDDQSLSYGTIFEDIPVDDDDKTHSLSLSLKAGTSPHLQIKLVFMGGSQTEHYVFLDGKYMTPSSGNSPVIRASLGNGWYRITIAGSNNGSGNKTARLQIYPRHGAANDTGSILIADPRFGP